MTTLAQVGQCIESHRLMAKGDHVLVALSGGPDSVALLHMLTRVRKSMKLGLSAVYINHRLRPQAAKKEEVFCRALCDRLKVEFHIRSEDVKAVARKQKISIEAAARKVRYEILEDLADDLGYDRIAVGHHADDQVETILFRLFRGTGPTGLTGMPYRRMRVIRPLLDLTRDQILDYLKRNRLEYCTDKSNRSLRFSRNFIRLKILPQVRGRLNPKVEQAILGLAEILDVDDEFLEAAVDRALRRVLSITPGGKFRLDLKRLRPYAKAVRWRLLRRCLKATCPTNQVPDKVTIERLDDLAVGSGGSLSLPDQTRAVATGDRLYLFRYERQVVNCPVETGRKLRLDWPAVNVITRVIDRRGATIDRKPGGLKVSLDWDRVVPPLEIRTIRPGDRFRPLGMTGRKKVGDLLTDNKVPRPERDETLLLCDRDGILWVVGQEIDERVRIGSKTRKVLRVAISIRRRPGRSAV